MLHQLRAFSPSELKVVDSVSKTFRQNENLNLKDEITNLKTGEALISFLNEDGSPEIVEKAMVLPPHSSFTPLTSMEILNLVDNDVLYSKYSEIIDRESAYEVLEEKMKNSHLKKEDKSTSRKSSSPVDQILNSFMRSVTRQIGSSLVRGLIGSLKKL